MDTENTPAPQEALSGTVLQPGAVSTQEANPGKAVNRTIFAVVLALFPTVNLILSAVNEWAVENEAMLPGWVFIALNAALAVAALITGLITKLLAIPAVNEWLRKGTVRSLLAPDNEPSAAAKHAVDTAAGPPGYSAL